VGSQKKLGKDMAKIVVAALYKFVRLDDFRAVHQSLRAFCQECHIKGTLLLAPEGINGTIAGSRIAIDRIAMYFRQDPRFDGLEYKESLTDEMPFRRLRVRLKKEIVTLGVEGLDPENITGTYVEPEDWNALLSDPEVILVDTRNQYEVDIGTFQKAQNPHTKHFREFPQFVKDHLDPHKHKKIALCCTGGIRCVKASSYMKEQGFEAVYQLKGGILKYLERVPSQESLWQGECFVFDERVAIKHGLEMGRYELCRGCRRPLAEKDKTSSFYQEGVSCPGCYAETTEKQKTRFAERQKQIHLAKKRHRNHLGDAYEGFV
jgi:UPF0176 protein